MQNRFSLLVSDVMPIHMIIALDIFTFICVSVNSSTVFFLPTVCYFKREASSENYDPWVYLYHILKILKNTLLHVYLIHFILYFCSIYLSITIQFNLANNRQGIDNPLFALGASICYSVCKCC